MTHTDWLGRIHGELTVVADLGVRDFGTYRKRVISCRCSCGAQIDIMANNLRKQRSCLACGSVRTADASRTHGLSHSRAWSVHHGMVQRCTNPKVKHFARYGGRGLGV